jgi:hypothetical protein
MVREQGLTHTITDYEYETSSMGFCMKKLVEQPKKVASPGRSIQPLAYLAHKWHLWHPTSPTPVVYHGLSSNSPPKKGNNFESGPDFWTKPT